MTNIYFSVYIVLIHNIYCKTEFVDKSSLLAKVLKKIILFSLNLIYGITFVFPSSTSKEIVFLRQQPGSTFNSEQDLQTETVAEGSIFQFQGSLPKHKEGAGLPCVIPYTIGLMRVLVKAEIGGHIYCLNKNSQFSVNQGTYSAILTNVLLYTGFSAHLTDCWASAELHSQFFNLMPYRKWLMFQRRAFLAEEHGYFLSSLLPFLHLIKAQVVLNQRKVIWFGELFLIS